MGTLKSHQHAAKSCSSFRGIKQTRLTEDSPFGNNSLCLFDVDLNLGSCTCMTVTVLAFTDLPVQ